MLAVLCGALYYYNFVDKPPVDYGSEVGAQCYSYDLPLYGSNGTISIDDTRGKVTVINFWGTWCTPCVTELVNEFPLIADEYGDKVAIIAMHSYDEYGVDVPAYIEKTSPVPPSSSAGTARRTRTVICWAAVPPGPTP